MRRPSLIATCGPAAKTLLLAAAVSLVAPWLFSSPAVSPAPGCHGCGGRCCVPAEAGNGCRVHHRCCRPEAAPTTLLDGWKATPAERVLEIALPVAPCVRAGTPFRLARHEGPAPPVPPPRAGFQSSIV